uniref:PHB domain-containing protein n=1 Tax=Rhabditophanes sp. KR3021 TaxID=114890 RepID=A0AC35TIW3_9BILA
MRIPTNLLKYSILLKNQRNLLQCRNSSRATNTIINFVPQQEAWVIERFGKFEKILEPGLNVLLPVVDQIKYVQSLKEIAIEIPQQGAITIDNVQLQLDGVLYLKVIDAYKASYGVDDPEFAVTQLAQTTMRSEVGKISLDTVFKERETLNVNIVLAINKAAEPWGLICLRYEIRNMTMPARIQEAMQMQVEAERKKRALILESEGKRDAAINVALGEKTARILSSEADMQESINQAKGQASAVEMKADAQKKAILQVAEALKSEGGSDAASLSVAEKYVAAFGKLAKENNTLIIPSNANDINSMVGQAMTVYKNIITNQQKQ